MQDKAASGDRVYQETEIDDGRISPAETTGRLKGPLSGIVADLFPIGATRALIGLGIP